MAYYPYPNPAHYHHTDLKNFIYHYTIAQLKNRDPLPYLIDDFPHDIRLWLESGYNGEYYETKNYTIDEVVISYTGRYKHLLASFHN